MSGCKGAKCASQLTQHRCNGEKESWMLPMFGTGWGWMSHMWQLALFGYNRLWSLPLRHLVTAALTGHCQHNMPIGVHLLRPGPAYQHINRQRCGVFFRAILAVPEKVGCVASVWVCLCAGRKWHSRKEPPDYKNDQNQETMLDPRSSLLV